jgi:type II secretory pathway pseudopilin PulG
MPSPSASGRISGSRRCRRSAFTLVEVLISSLVMAIVLGGSLALIMQTRRLTEGSIVQMATVNVLQGYIEQMKNMDYNSLRISPAAAGTTVVIPTQIDEVTPDPLTLSWGSPPPDLPAMNTVPPGAIDNTKNITIRNPAVNPNDTISINVWIWVQDLTGASTNVTNAKSITMIYTYRFRDGGRVRAFRGSIRSIRSVVPTF